MSKRAIKFFILLAGVTASISAFFITCSFLVDMIFTTDSMISDAFYYIRTAFDLVAEFTAFGIVIYAFCRYSAKQAIPSVLISLGSFIFSAVFQIGATAVVQIINGTDLSVGDVIGNIGIDLLLGLLGLTIERLIPCIVIALIAFLSAMHGTQRISRVVSFKNPAQRAMLISCFLMYLINAVPQFVLTMLDLINYGGPSNMYAEEFFAFIGYNVILNQGSILIYNLVLQYLVYLFIYYLCQKHEENAPIKKHKGVAACNDDSTTVIISESSSEEK